MSREGTATLAIYIIPFKVFIAVILSILVTGFPIWKGFVISNMTDNKKLVDNKKMIKLADAEGLVDTEEPVDIKEPIVICYE